MLTNNTKFKSSDAAGSNGRSSRGEHFPDEKDTDDYVPRGIGVIPRSTQGDHIKPK